MKKRKKIVVLMLGGIAVLLLLIGSLILLAPKLINSEFAKREIVTHLSRSVGGQVNIADTDFSFFPQPHAVIRGASLSIAGRVSAEIESVTVYPKVWPLLSGRIEIAKLSAQSPRFNIDFPSSSGLGKDAPGPFSGGDLPKKTASSMVSMASKIEGLSIHVQDGRINLVKGEKTVLWFDHIRLRVENPSKQLDIDLGSESNLWKGISLKARLDLAERKAEGKIHLNDLRLQSLPDDLLPQGPLKIGDSETDLNLAFKADLSKGFKADIQGSVPSVTLQHKDEKVVFKGTNVTGSIHLETDSTTISVSALNLDYPRLDLSGQMVMESGAPRVRVDLKAKGVDVPSIREVALKIGGDIPDVQRIFAVVMGGQVPLITVSSHGNSMDDLGKLGHIVINGRIHKGRIFVPGTGMDLADVNGEALISEGILTGTRLEARLGKTYGSNGSLKLGLAEDNPLFHLDMLLKADLADALPVLKGLINDPVSKEKLGLIDDIKGNATARLVLGESTSSITARVEASEFDLSARYRPIPYLLQAKGGRLSYDNRVVNVQKIEGSIGRSSISRLSGRLNWQEEGFMEVQSGTCSILLDEIYPWVSSFDAAKKALKEITRVKGSIILNSLDIKGPLLKPEAWRFKTGGRIKDLALGSTRLPGPVALAEGSVEADADTIIFDDAKLRILDARLNLSGLAKGYMTGVNRLEATFHGDVGQEGIRSISERIHLPDDVRLTSPVTISKAHLVWDKKAKTSFSGDLSVPDGPNVSLDVIKTPRILKVNKLIIKDGTSNATVNFSVGNDVVDIGFSGNLTGASLASLLAKNDFLTGWIKGDLWGRIVPGNAIESTIEGSLQGGDISLRQLDLPAKIDTFSLDASQQRLRFISDIHALDNRQIGVDADLNLSEQGILFRLDIAADGINLDRMKTAFEKLSRKSEGGRDQMWWSVPVKGTAHIKLGSLTYGKYEWKPFNCDISSEGNTVRIAISEAALCGISTPGSVEVSPGKLLLRVRPASEGRDLTPTIACLTRESLQIGGTFDFKGDLKGEGTGEALIRSLNGPIHFVSKNGRIDRFGLLMQIFSLLNITEIFRGQLPDLRSQGFAYHSITVDGHLKEGTLHLEKALLDASSMNIACTGQIDLLKQQLDLTVFAAPFKTADRILRMLPIIGYVMDDTLISIAIKVTGDLKNPKVDYLPAAMLSSGILGVMKRTLEAPVKVVTPMIPK